MSKWHNKLYCVYTQGQIKDLKEGEPHRLCHRRKEAGDQRSPLYSIEIAFVGYTRQ